MKTILEKNVQIPSVPSFLICDDGTKVSIGQLPEKELRKIAKEWTESLINRAKLQVTNAVTTAVNR